MDKPEYEVMKIILWVLELIRCRISGKNLVLR